ncbi:folylpolyglutamate synthase [Reticulomyxa filosa]|uniref:Folylpolyglutamate synthase n=1 Tax=Reticulomyxa filosa TaxID=46433 RepID=X6N8X0_RETFI|nr:folylpolyglutamate synthase [Reticulomyxa filosa]|eukprot:ETO22740.1 folylpolyglutamate synthase [Reticulomyxa filosa]
MDSKTHKKEMISQEAMIDCVETLLDMEKKFNVQNVSFFEFITVLGFEHFKREKVDIGVIEVGLGVFYFFKKKKRGRFDATNIIEDPLLSVITSISLHHTDILGDTIEEIAFEKAGIIKPKRPVVIGPTVPKEIIYREAKKTQSEVFSVELNKKGFVPYDEENQNTAKLCLKVLANELKGLEARLDKIMPQIDQLLSIRPPCRFEEHTLVHPELLQTNKYLLYQNNLHCVLDVGHDDVAINNFFETLQLKYPKTQYSYRIITGLSRFVSFVHTFLFAFVFIFAFECVHTNSLELESISQSNTCNTYTQHRKRRKQSRD